MANKNIIPESSEIVEKKSGKEPERKVKKPVAAGVDFSDRRVNGKRGSRRKRLLKNGSTPESAKKTAKTRAQREAALPEEERETLRQKRAAQARRNFSGGSYSKSAAAKKAAQTRALHEAALSEEEREALREKRAARARRNFGYDKPEGSSPAIASVSITSDYIIHNIIDFYNDYAYKYPQYTEFITREVLKNYLEVNRERPQLLLHIFNSLRSDERTKPEIWYNPDKMAKTLSLYTKEFLEKLDATNEQKNAALSAMVESLDDFWLQIHLSKIEFGE